MLKFVSKALLPLVIDKQARQNLKERRAAAKAARASVGNAPAGEDAPTPEGARPLTPEREELIRQARAVHRSKAKLLDDLSEEQRQRLYEIALKQLCGISDKENDR